MPVLWRGRACRCVIVKIAQVSSRLRSLAQQCSSDARLHVRDGETALVLRSTALECAQTAKALDNGVGYYRSAAELTDRAIDTLVEAAMERVTDLTIDEVLHG